jgi:hypothetical protein
VCEIFQGTINDPYYELLLQLSAGEPDYILFSSAIWNSVLITQLCHDLATCKPSCRLIIGGPQASALADKVDNRHCSLVIGAIEEIDPRFFRDLAAAQLQPVYRQAQSGYRKRFDYPYKTEDFSTHLAHRSIYYESSRGCPFRCSYCLSATQRAMVHKDLDVVERELLDIISHKPKTVRFVDRTFNDVPERALSIWRLLRERGKGTLFHFEIAPDRFTEDMHSFLATVPLGLFQFEIGIQTTNLDTLAAIDRRIDPQLAHDNVRRLASLGNIHLHVDLILGLPHETRETFRQSFRDVFAMEAHYIQMGLLKILPETPLAAQQDAFAYLSCSQPPYQVLGNRWLEHKALAELFWFSECVEKFVNNRYFLSLWRYLRRQGEDVYAFFAELLKQCHDSGFFAQAATQEVMCRIIAEIAGRRDDGWLIVELLRYDWLRCGFRFLPDCLGVPETGEQPAATRSRLYQSMPAEFPGLYNKAERNYFFRKSFFLKTSAQLMEAVGLSASGGGKSLCFLADKVDGIHPLCRVVVL